MRIEQELSDDERRRSVLLKNQTQRRERFFREPGIEAYVICVGVSIIEAKRIPPGRKSGRERIMRYRTTLAHRAWKDISINRSPPHSSLNSQTHKPTAVIGGYIVGKPDIQLSDVTRFCIVSKLVLCDKILPPMRPWMRSRKRERTLQSSLRA